MAANGLLAQDLANLLGITVERPANVESSTLGAAMLGAVGSGMHATLEAAAAAMRGAGEEFVPDSEYADRAARIERWDRAVAAVVSV